MKKIIEYKTVKMRFLSIDIFDEDINSLITAGFQPYLGPTVSTVLNSTVLYQIMVRYDDEAEITMTPQQLNEWVDKNAEFQFTDETHETSKLCFLDAEKRIQESKDEQW